MKSVQCGNGNTAMKSGNHNSQRAAGGGGGAPITTQAQFEQAAEQEILKIDPTGENAEIWRVRRQLGDRVSREDFDERMLEMQRQDKIRIDGSSLAASPFKNPAVQGMIIDSIETPLSGLRTYVRFPQERQKQLKAEAAKRLERGEKLTKKGTDTSGRTVEQTIRPSDLK